MKIRKSDIIIWLVILLNIIFTIVVLYIFYKVKTEPVVLIGELGSALQPSRHGN